MASHLIDRSPEAMSRRARIYIAAGGSRHLLVGLTILLFPWLYSAAAFIPIFNLIDQVFWGWLMSIVGVVCIAGAVTRNADIARAGMVGSAAITAVLAVGLTIGLTNVWLMFGQHVGAAEVLHLMRTHPRIFPLELAARMVAPPSPFLALLLLSVSVKDFTMCAQPMRTPVEDRVVRAISRKA
jgi:hypothetical protein